MLTDAALAQRWLAQIAPLVRRLPAAADGAIGARLRRPGCVLFEGAQGVLLDEWRGFHPHTTWSSTTPAAAEAVAREAGQSAAMEHLGVLRTYLTRHGAGPLPTDVVRLDLLTEPHNGADGWQGVFRRGHPDALLLRYALTVAGPFSGLLLSHLDVFQRERALRWCEAYEVESGGRSGADGGVAAGVIGALVAGAAGDLDHQARLTQLLAAARPRYAARAIGSAARCIDDLETRAALPVRFAARGPTHADVARLGAPW
ncbi:adenylosuccinate synthetase [Massilia sp. PWRC2]|uniref:adenylosuccinate synthetase n=1 Tax=Massilia sp. PWRC2 TaxID=2804626 RepID=UPI003CE9059C